MMRFLPFVGSLGSLNPSLASVPYPAFSLSIEGMRSFVSGAGLNQNCIDVPATTGFSTRSDSGN